MKTYGAPLSGIEAQILESLKDYRHSRKRPGGLFLTSGPTDTLIEISSLIDKNCPEYEEEMREQLQKFLKENKERQLVFDDKYDPVLKQVYEMMSHIDGASHFENGYLREIERHIDSVKINGIKGGTRHRAGAYASLKGPGLKSYVLSEETRNITLFDEGKPLIVHQGRRTPDVPEAYFTGEEALQL